MRRTRAALACLTSLVALAACAAQPAARTTAPSPAPTGGYAVAQRTLTFTDSSRVTDPTPGRPGDESQGRVLSTTIWYPDSRGPFPVVLFSHGLLGVPADYEALATHWASAGFVVVAPAYPLTHRGASAFQLLDVVNQPADAAFVLTSVLHQATIRGDRFQGLLDPRRLAAAGHSAGAITTVGIFTACCRDARLRAGIVLAGNAIGFSDSYVGPPAPMLFVHGDRDPIVPYVTGQAAYAPVPWPKAFVTLPGQGHLDPYLQPTGPAFAVVEATTTDFLRWSLLGDRAGLAALRQDAVVPGMASLDDHLG